MRRTHRFYCWSALLLLLLLLVPGCKSKSGLTQHDNYTITIISPQGDPQSFPVQLSWNSNMVVVQKFLMEATFTLSDLNTPESPSLESTPPSNPSEIAPELLTSDELDKNEQPQKSTVLIKALFPESRIFNLTINDNSEELILDSIEIEIEGSQPGRVILNDHLILQGINDPNLKPAFDELLKMLNGTALKDSIKH